jgi:hypothetical protein
MFVMYVSRFPPESVRSWPEKLKHAPRRTTHQSLRAKASAAASRSAAHRAPGRRPILSIGPDTDTAAITVPRPSRTGAETLATPGSRSATLCAQPRLRTSASVRSLNFAVGRTACCVAASL